MKISSETRHNVAALVWERSAGIRSPQSLSESAQLPVRERDKQYDSYSRKYTHLSWQIYMIFSQYLVHNISFTIIIAEEFGW
jgi:hypothetical protein